MKETFLSIGRIFAATLMVMGVALLPSFLVSMICHEYREGIYFIIMAAVGFLIGAAFRQLTKRYRGRRLHIGDGFLAVTCVWIFVSLVGAIPYLVTGALADPLDAIFESCSGFTTTGATVFAAPAKLTHGILFWRSMTGWLGGVGILLFGIALMPALGLNAQRLTAVETHAAMESLTPKMIETIRVIFFIYGLITILEVLLLAIGRIGIFNAFIYSMSTVSTTGFCRYNDGLGHFDSGYVHLIFILFMVFSGINFNLYINAYRVGFYTFRRNTEVRVYTAMIFASGASISLYAIARNNGADILSSIDDAFLHCTAMLSTTGFAYDDVTHWPTFCQMILLLLIITGACSSSPGGGLKIARVAILMKLIKHGISMRLHSNFFERVKLNGQGLTSDVVSGVATVPFLFIVTLFAGAFALTMTGFSMSTAFNSALACLCNTGYAMGNAGPFADYASCSHAVKGILDILMIGGRLELYSVLVLLTPTYWEQSY